MIGNDVIDLDLASRQSNWKRPRFLDKLFTGFEKELILSSADPEKKVWDLWSRKEAAYKIVNRETGERLFNPTAFECLDDGANGKIKYQSQILSTKTFYNTSRIHTVCSEGEKLLEKIGYCSRIQISKPDGFPVFVQNEDTFPASVSHHGRFISCVYLNR
ncbi:4'-phosphopantetheinyl transferase family protein [Flavobacterium silvaticum]|uniref:4-phosphopantetheinyl transferase family protein n=1 Tax=Flavobacterium silvaticum TaxID=1852020 RepID=A0A972JJ44_9FLAO|nr:4'-phosphopantetheinyl transferase superfamily protein [Flavobacterium silvaticum]NMH28978.1 4-phosphopantetheinyl transferase family protein [Flavobacterium silvaticum]